MDVSARHALRTVQTYQQLAPRYDRVSPVASSLLFGSGAAVLPEVLAAIAARPGETILDVCCGTGALAAALAPAVLPGGSVTGVDLCGEMLAVARTKTSGEHVRFVEGNAERLPLEGDAFDRVCCTLSLHEMPPAVRQAALRELRRVTRPFGRVYLVDWHLPDGLLRGLLLHAAIRLALRPEIGVDFLTGGVVAEATAAGLVVERFATFAGGGLQLVVARKV